MIDFTIYEGPKTLGSIACTSWDIRAIKKALKHYFKHYYGWDFKIDKNRCEGWVEVMFFDRRFRMEEVCAHWAQARIKGAICKSGK